MERYYSSNEPPGANERTEEMGSGWMGVGGRGGMEASLGGSAV